MKFAKEIEQDLVPEWRAKYLDYKQGKKKLKAVARAIRNAARTPNSANLRGSSPSDTRRQAQWPVYNYLTRPAVESEEDDSASGQEGDGDHTEPGPGRSAGDTVVPFREPFGASPAVPIPSTQTEAAGSHDHRGLTRYGSIIGSPPQHSEMSETRPGNAPSLKLPAPALTGNNNNNITPQSTSGTGGESRTAPEESSDKNTGQRTNPEPRKTRHASLMPKNLSMLRQTRTNSMPGPREVHQERPLMRRLFSLRPGQTSQTGSHSDDIAMHAYREIDERQSQFFKFLDKELDKIEDFYKLKEDEATQRLKVLREQLHIMRDRRLDEIVQANIAKRQKHSSHATDRPDSKPGEGTPLLSNDHDRTVDLIWRKPLDKIKNRAKVGHIGRTFEVMKELSTPSGPLPLESSRDYSRKPVSAEVSYRTAKHKLKIALAEYYRGLELLKSYALLNRTAFRKINKKFDKTVNARPSGRYMSEKVNNAYFVTSDVLDGHIKAIEDLYARYFERGSHKIAVGKLRAKAGHAGDYTSSVFRSGVMLTGGVIFGLQGLVLGSEKLFDSDPVLTTQTSYLLQIYAGYFLMLLLSLFFCLACRVWHDNKVNYQFIFEFDNRHTLDWRQLSEIPCLFGFLFGLIVWINFNGWGGSTLYIYWPVILIGISTLILFNPLPTAYWRSRSWFARSVGRLSLAGIFPVEFRDFFLGDLFCSETYAMGNLELFFCLYAQHPPWRDPPQCNSSHSRLLGFLATLPGIWRALQCLRRYRDTRNWFPHLANCGKYMFTILYYMSLSLYRFNHHSYSLKAFFIFCALVNAVYCSIWDVVMDWSLGLDPHTKHRGLRQTLAYKSTWPYYLAMIVDPIIRFNWIFYAIYTSDVQHSTIVSFLVGLTEVCRRGMWMLFRVENEHCTNVGRFRASRDAPLPYELPSSSSTTLASKSPTDPAGQATPAGHAQNGSSQHTSEVPQSTIPQGLGVNLERTRSRSGAAAESLRRSREPPNTSSPVARALSRVGTALYTAHAQDFERKRRPELGNSTIVSDDEDDDDNDVPDSDDDVRESLPYPRSVERPHQGNGRHDGRRRDDSDQRSPLSSDGSAARADAEADIEDLEDLRRARSAIGKARQTEE